MTGPGAARRNNVREWAIALGWGVVAALAFGGFRTVVEAALTVAGYR